MADLNRDSQHLDNDAPSRQAGSDGAGRPTPVPPPVGADIRDEVGRRYLSSLLQESALWLAIMRHAPPAGWNEQTQRGHEVMLSQLRDVFADRSADSHTCGAARAWLMGYCRTMRAQHDGACASDVLRRCRNNAVADGADLRTNRDGSALLGSEAVASP